MLQALGLTDELEIENGLFSSRSLTHARQCFPKACNIRPTRRRICRLVGCGHAEGRDACRKSSPTRAASPRRHARSCTAPTSRARPRRERPATERRLPVGKRTGSPSRRTLPPTAPTRWPFRPFCVCLGVVLVFPEPLAGPQTRRTDRRGRAAGPSKAHVLPVSGRRLALGPSETAEQRRRLAAEGFDPQDH
jgi:hypothetical protein